MRGGRGRPGLEGGGVGGGVRTGTRLPAKSLALAASFSREPGAGRYSLPPFGRLIPPVAPSRPAAANAPATAAASDDDRDAILGHATQTAQSRRAGEAAAAAAPWRLAARPLRRRRSSASRIPSPPPPSPLPFHRHRHHASASPPALYASSAARPFENKAAAPKPYWGALAVTQKAEGRSRPPAHMAPL